MKSRLRVYWKYPMKKSLCYEVFFCRIVEFISDFLNIYYNLMEMIWIYIYIETINQKKSRHGVKISRNSLKKKGTIHNSDIWINALDSGGIARDLIYWNSNPQRFPLTHFPGAFPQFSRQSTKTRAGARFIIRPCHGQCPHKRRIFPFDHSRKNAYKINYRARFHFLAVGAVMTPLCERKGYYDARLD